MRNIILVLTAVVLSASAFAKAPADGRGKAKFAVASAKGRKKLTQEANFTGATVNGKYQIAGGAVSAVENEKTLNDIVDGRKDFKDRLKADLGKTKSSKNETVE